MTTAIKTYSQSSGNRKVSLDLVPNLTFTTDKTTSSLVADVKTDPAGGKLVSINGRLHETPAMVELQNLL